MSASDDSSRRKRVIGLVGGMGSGKSSVSALLQQRGGYLISADELGHEALRQPEVIERVVGRWGAGVLDEGGNVDRRKLGRIVFSEACELKALEGLVFPYIERRIREEVGKAERLAQARFVVLDAAIMLEAGWADACDSIVFVHVPRSERLRRLGAQRGWTEAELAAREDAQLSVAEKISRADYVLDNSGPPEETAKQIEDLLDQLKLDRSEVHC
jgi:dephospho-CoA kinase